MKSNKKIYDPIKEINDILLKEINKIYLGNKKHCQFCKDKINSIKNHKCKSWTKIKGDK